jgi:hypothetical protein
LDRNQWQLSTGIGGNLRPEYALHVMFQNIIYNGLIANDFMKRFTVTYDLPNSAIILAS